MKNTIRLIGVGHHLPGEPVSTQQILEWGKIKVVDEKWVSDKLGIKTRHISRNMTSDKQELKEGCATSDLCAKAALNALKSGGIELSEIDMIIVSTCTPDVPVPGTSTYVQEKLGIKEVATMDIRSACCGPFQAIATAEQYCKTGYFKTVLVCGSDTGSVFGDMDLGREGVERKDCVNALMIGDGAGAVVMRGFSKDETPYGIELVYTTIKSIGPGQKPGLWFPSGGCVMPFSKEVIENRQQYFQHNFREVLEHGPELYWRSLQAALQDNSLGIHDIALYIPHQANGKIKEFGVKFGAKEENVYFNFDRVGNTANASCLIALSEVVEQNLVNEGEMALLMGAESTKWLYGSILLKFHSLKKTEQKKKSAVKPKKNVSYTEKVCSGLIVWGVGLYFKTRKIVRDAWTGAQAQEKEKKQ